MIINKVINNNVLSTHDENNREIVLMGKGIGFQKKVGDEVAEDKIEKRFVLDSEECRQLLKMLIRHWHLTRL